MTSVIEKAILTISRFTFLSIIGILTIVFLNWEFSTLRQMGNKKVFAGTQRIGINNTSNLVISESGNVNSLNMEISAQVKSDDARPIIIKNYLEKYNSPLVPYSDLIFQLSKTYGFEYYWIVAIAQQESNLCKKIPEGSNNCWGYGIHKRGTLTFDNYEIALKSYAEYLKREYFDKGLDTPELIMKKYCPSSDGSWARGVRQFIGEMETGKF